MKILTFKEVKYCKRCGLMYFGKPLARMCALCKGDLEDVPAHQIATHCSTPLESAQDTADEACTHPESFDIDYGGYRTCISCGETFLPSRQAKPF